MKLRIQDTMLGYKCNQKGCCCKGWGIPFEGEDVGRLLQAFEPDSREVILEGAQVDVDGEGNLKHIRLRSVGEEAACQFLEGGGQCGIHRAMGPEILPHLCQSFPAFSYDLKGERELHYDAICPEVLNRIAMDDGPISIVEVEVEPGEDLHTRGARPKEMPEIHFGGRALSTDELGGMRGLVLGALGEERGSALETLGHINHTLSRLGQGAEPQDLGINWDEDTSDFDAFFDSCFPIHDPHLLARFLLDYKRFIYRLELDWSDTSSLVACLEAQSDWREHLDPERADLQPLLFRYLSHRFFSAFDRSPMANRLEFSYGTINHCLAVVFRYAIAISRWQSRPVDKDLMVVAIGAAEYVFRVFRVPQFSMPWFGAELVTIDDDPAQ